MICDMRFSTKQKNVSVMIPEDGVSDVIVLKNEREIMEADEQGTETKSFIYDGNIFRVQKELTEEEVLENLDYYMDFESEEKLTVDEQAKVDKAIDDYTAQLIEEGVI